MCGLVGIMATGALSDRQLGLFQNLLYVDKVRGEHATGVIKVNPWAGSVEMHKRAVSAQVYLGQEDALNFMDKPRGRIYIGHNRYATVGDKSADANAHPFQEGHITMVHNGGVDYWARDKLEGHTDPDVVVDSHQVCKTIAKHGIEETVPKLSGAFALIWWDDQQRTLNFIRNNERPLWMCELTDGAIVWASEKEFIDFFVTRKKSTFSYRTEPKELPVNQLISFQFNEHGVILNRGKPVMKELKFTKIPDPKPVTRGNGYGNYYGNYNQTTPRIRGVENYEARINRILSYWKIPAKANQSIIMKVTKIEDCNHSPRGVDKVNVYLEYEKMECVCYYVDKAKVEGAKFLQGEISNAIERKVKYQGVEWEEPEIIIGSHTIKRVLNAPKPIVTSIGPYFPLKCHGHTFQNRTEFTDFVSKGCDLCGQVPGAYDLKNKSMTVYATDTFSGLLEECTFICGQCVQESEKDNEPK